MARGTCIPRPQGTLWIRKTVLGWLTPQGYWRESKLKHTPSFPMKQKWLFTCLGTSAWGSGFTFATHLEAIEVLSGNKGMKIPPLYSPFPSLQLAGTSQEETHTLHWSPDYCNFFPGNSSRPPGLETTRVYNCGPTGLYIFEYLKRCLRI